MKEVHASLPSCRVLMISAGFQSADPFSPYRSCAPRHRCLSAHSHLASAPALRRCWPGWALFALLLVASACWRRWACCRGAAPTAGRRDTPDLGRHAVPGPVLVAAGVDAAARCRAAAALARELSAREPARWQPRTRHSAVAVPALGIAATFVGLLNARRTAQVKTVDDAAGRAAGGTARLHASCRSATSTSARPSERATCEAIVERVNALKPDLVAITGDLVDGSVPELAAAGRAAGPAGVPARQLLRHGQPRVLLGRGTAGWSELRRLGIRCCTTSTWCSSATAPNWCWPACPTTAPTTSTRPIAATPRPHCAGAPAKRRQGAAGSPAPQCRRGGAGAGFDLQLSGHTHGGQFLPWRFFVQFQQPFTAGLHKVGRMWIYVSRGTGYWGPPKRFGAPSEITQLRLMPAAV